VQPIPQFFRKKPGVGPAERPASRETGPSLGRFVFADGQSHRARAKDKDIMNDNLWSQRDDDRDERASDYFRPSRCLTVGQSRLSAMKAARSGQRRNGFEARSRPIVELGRTP
jgi:hypothetical protein